MSSLSFFQVTQNGGHPRVDVGTIAAKELEADSTKRHPRLRIYAFDPLSASGVSVKALETASRLVMLVTQPGSSLRSELLHVQHGRRFFRAPVTDFSAIMAYTFKSWRDIAKSVQNDTAVLLEMDGTTDELIRLLDAYHDDRFAAAQATTVGYNPRDGATYLRDRLLKRNWSDGRAVGELLGYPNEKNPAQHAYRLRAAGELFGVWSPKGRYVHPDFQFENGSIRPRVRELLEALPQRSDDGGWGNAFWLHSPHPLLDNAEPAAVFETDPQRVLDLAKDEFSGEKDGGW